MARTVPSACVTVMIAPPFPFLYELGKARVGASVKLGAQDMFFEQAGAYTGEVSPKMLADAGADINLKRHGRGSAPWLA